MIGRSRSLVVVEVQTSGPDPRFHRIVEVAGINTATGTRVHLRWPLSAGEYQRADAETLRLIDYDHRFSVGAAQEHTSLEYVRDRVTDLSHLLIGNTLGAIDPVTSAAFLVRLFAQFELRGGWHRRFADLGALAAGAKGLPATAIPQLSSVAAMLDLDRDARPATALEAAELAAACFALLQGERDQSPTTTTTTTTTTTRPVASGRHLHVVAGTEEHS